MQPSFLMGSKSIKYMVLLAKKISFLYDFNHQQNRRKKLVKQSIKWINLAPC